MGANEIFEESRYVALTHDTLDAKPIMDRVRNPKAGAIVVFAGNVFLRVSNSNFNEYTKVPQETTSTVNR
jgi:molybdopterin synthase catalytic subunit